MADNATLARRMYAAWNERNFDEIAEATAPDAILTVVGSGDTFEGPDGSRVYNAMWADGFPDGEVTVDRLIEAGDLVVVEFTGRGTHTGTLETSMGSIPATGRSVTARTRRARARRGAAPEGRSTPTATPTGSRSPAP